MPIMLSAAGLTSTLVGFVGYLRRINTETVPRRPVGTLLLMLTGVVLAGMALRIGSGGAAVYGLSSMTVAVAGLFVFLLRQAPLPDGELQIGVGDTLLPFEVLDSRGVRVSTDAFVGRRILLKFFRGGW